MHVTRTYTSFVYRRLKNVVRDLITRLPRSSYVDPRDSARLETQRGALIPRALALIDNVTGRLPDVLDLPTKEEVRGDSQHDEYQNEGKYVEQEVGVEHVQFLQRRFRVLEVAIHLLKKKKTPSVLVTVITFCNQHAARSKLLR